MAKRKHKKYMRTLISIPDDLWAEFMRVVPNGQRSEFISNLIREYISKTFPPKKHDKKTFWDEIDKYRKGDYSHEDPVEFSKHAWDDVD